MGLTPVKRSKLIHLLNTAEIPTTGNRGKEWNLINEGVTTLTEDFNPDTETIQYIAEDSKTTFTKNYGVSMTISISVIDGDDKVNEYLRKRIFELPTGATADEEYIRCCLLDKQEATSGQETNVTKYTSYMQEANLAVSNIGGDAGEYLVGEVNLNGKGEYIKGTLSVTKTTDETSGKTKYTYSFDPDTTT